MTDQPNDRKNLEVIRDFNSAAEGIANREDMYVFANAGDRLGRRFNSLMNTARTGAERGELLQSMAAVLVNLSQQNFSANDGLRGIETTTRVVQSLGDIFISNLGLDTVPEFYSTDQLNYLSGHLKSAAQVREDMSGYFPNRPNSFAISEQAQVFRKLAEGMDAVSAKLGGDAPKPEVPLHSSRPGRRERDNGGGDRPVRTRF